MKKHNKEYEEIFNEAIKYRDEGNLPEACRLLDELIDKFPKEHYAYIIKGGILQNQGMLLEAYFCYSTASKMHPTSTFASLGVFHTLWDIEKNREAIDEIKRFQSTGEVINDYEEIMAELREKKLIDDNLNWISDLNGKF